MNYTTADIWTWMLAKCNAEEIAEFIGVTKVVALALMENARQKYLDNKGVL